VMTYADATLTANRMTGYSPLADGACNMSEKTENVFFP
jgi:hypothetical protein